MRWLLSVVAATAVATAGPVVAQGNDARGNGKGKDSGKVQHSPSAGNGNNADDAKRPGKAKGHDNAATTRGAVNGPGKQKSDDRRITSERQDEYRSGVAWRDNRREDRTLAADDRQIERPRRGANDRGFKGGQTAFLEPVSGMRTMVPSCPPGLEKKNNGCLPPGLEKNRNDPVFGYEYRPSLFGVFGSRGGRYAYRDGYLLPLADTASGYIPLLGGALAVGQPWPQTYPSYVVPQYVGDYFGVGDRDRYRYADNVVYRVDPVTAAIEAITALLTGSDFQVGEPLPPGYDVYNLPRSYRDRYVDGPDALYRYADGRIYQVEPQTMRIARAIDLVL